MSSRIPWTVFFFFFCEIFDTKFVWFAWLIFLFFRFDHMFCDFFIDKNLNYDDLASGLKEALENDKSVFDADHLQKITGNYTSFEMLD